MTARTAIRTAMVVFGAVACANPDASLNPYPGGAGRSAVVALWPIAAKQDTGTYIVFLNGERAQTAVRSRAMIAAAGGKERYVYEALGGFAVSGITSAAADELAQNPNVRLIEREGVDQAATFDQTLPLGGQLYHLDRIDKYGTYAYDQHFLYDNTGAGAHVYIIDTGIRYDHVDFSGRIGVGVCFTGITCSPYQDPASHGTYSASVAAGTTHGVAKLATIHSVKIDDDGSNISHANIVAGFNWVLQNRQLPAVANLSTGGIPSSFAIRDAIDQLVVNGNVLVFKAAGNDGQNAFNDQGNRCLHCIVVSATNSVDVRVSNANYGPTVTLMAPGFNYEVASSASSIAVTLQTGTSIAAPLAAGVAAALLSTNSALTAGELKNLILNGASPVVISNGLGVANRVLYSRIVPPNTIVASILGPNPVLPGTTCRYVASAGGAPGPYSYAWTIDGSPAGTNSAILDVTNSGVAYDVGVTISAPGATPGATNTNVSMSGGATPCDE